MTVPSVHSSAVPSPFLPAEVREDLRRYAEAGGFTLRAETHPWYAAAASVAGQDEARAASTVLAELRGRDLPLLRDAAQRLSAVPGLPAPGTAEAVASAVGLLLRVRTTLTLLRPEVYDTDPAELAALIAGTAAGAWRTEHGVSQSWLRRRALTRQARRLVAGRRAGRTDLHRALASAAAERTEWTELTGGAGRPLLPADPAFLDDAAQAADAARTGLRELGRLLRPEQPLQTLPLAELADLLDRLAADEGTLYRLPRLRALRDGLLAQGVEKLLAELTERSADAAETDAFLARSAPTAHASSAPEAPAPDLAKRPADLPEPETAADAAAEPDTRAMPEAEQTVSASAAAVLVDEGVPATLAESGAAFDAAETEALPEPEKPVSDAGETEAAASPALPEDVEAEPADAVAETPVTAAEEEAAEEEAPEEEAAEAAADLAPEPETEAPVAQRPDADVPDASEPDAPEPVTAAEPEAAPGTEVNADAEAEPVTAAEPDAEASAAPEAEPVTADGPEAAPDTDADAEPEPAAAQEATSGASPAADSAAAEADSESQPEAEEPEAEAREAHPEPHAEAPIQPAAGAEPEAAPAAVAEPAPDAAPATPTEAEAETVPEVEADAEAATAAASSSDAVPGPARRSRKPAITPGRPVTAYSAEQLEAVVRWLDGDGEQRTDEELLRAAMKEFGFSRLGPRIKEALGAAVAAVRG